MVQRIPTFVKQITKEELKAATGNRNWDLGNRALYEICEKHPKHDRIEAIIAKIWLIGRSYSAAIERRRKENVLHVGDKFYEQEVAPRILESGIDTWLESVSSDEEPGSPNSIEVHKRLLDLFHAITGMEKRSLASKYLHFHKPHAFYIYDSRARRAIAQLVPRIGQTSFSESLQFDREYRDFARRCNTLREHLHAVHSTIITPRDLDKVLIARIDGQF